jgi:hypothetical protein
MTFSEFLPIGVRISIKAWNLLSEPIIVDLQNLHSPVQIWALPFSETPPIAVFFVSVTK